ncbi:hypothetical protein PIB30_006795 [Stylosanthes scabra]|uniref:Uncharacterized protein n=1 Tax=Stylosanthes scabra TaxID=79078 RepID=A0ABU6U726_9FABA|nr:hypothetical protein [Stylosanthes scabra]
MEAGLFQILERFFSFLNLVNFLNGLLLVSISFLRDAFPVGCAFDEEIENIHHKSISRETQISIILLIALRKGSTLYTEGCGFNNDVLMFTSEPKKVATSSHACISAINAYYHQRLCKDFELNAFCSYLEGLAQDQAALKMMRESLVVKEEVFSAGGYLENPNGELKCLMGEIIDERSDGEAILGSVERILQFVLEVVGIKEENIVFIIHDKSIVDWMLGKIGTSWELRMLRNRTRDEESDPELRREVYA